MVTSFQKWLSQICFEERAIESIAPDELDGFLSNYIVMKKKKDGSDYEPDTLTANHRGILR